MELRYLRFKLFRALLAPFSGRARRRRMEDFVRLMGVRPNLTILDLGGQPSIWHLVDLPAMRITILNLPGVVDKMDNSHHDISYVEGDGCAVAGFDERRFDCVFSNSVIEHVGGPDKQALFAAEVRRLGRAYWVQTPAKAFPVEAHSGMPWWWYYPAWLRHRLIERWRRKLPEWATMIETTTVLTRQELATLFPDALIHTERVLGVPKSYVAYRPLSE